MSFGTYAPLPCGQLASCATRSSLGKDLESVELGKESLWNDADVKQIRFVFLKIFHASKGSDKPSLSSIEVCQTWSSPAPMWPPSTLKLHSKLLGQHWWVERKKEYRELLSECAYSRYVLYVKHVYSNFIFCVCVLFSRFVNPSQPKSTRSRI